VEPAGGDGGPQPHGMSLLRELMIAAAVLAFFVVWVVLLAKVWNAPDDKPPELDDLLVGAGAGLAGAIGAGFALAMGLEKKKPDDESLAYGPGLPRFDPEKTRSWILTVGIYGYAALSATALATWLLNQDETPKEIQALAIGFAGYVLSLVTSAFSAVQAAD
jgi:hypothetical protein